MGTMVGHVAPGMGFLVFGLWHLHSHIRLYSLRPSSYASPAWFPTRPLRHLELYLIMAGCCASIAMELFIGPERHQPLDDDGTIPSNHLHNFEHASISLTFLLYALSALLLDRARPRAQRELTHVAAAVAFAQQLLMFHLHSADHEGPEGQYHLLLQASIVVSLATALMGLWHPKSFAVSFVRSASLVLQGAWMVVMGVVLWTPALVFKGCFMNAEEGHYVVRCSGPAVLARAKSLVNIQFSWFLAGVAMLSVVFYLCLAGKYTGEEYKSLMGKEMGEEEEEDDVESQRKGQEVHRFVRSGKEMKAFELD